MSFVVLFVGCFMLNFNVATYVETLDSLGTKDSAAENFEKKSCNINIRNFGSKYAFPDD